MRCRRVFMTGMAVLLFTSAAVAQKDTKAALVQKLKADLSVSLFDKTLAAVEVRDCASGEILYSQHADLLLRPASNAKLFTSAAAVLGLPKDFVFRTVLASTDSSGRSLVLQGSADPLFGEQDIQKLAKFAQLKGSTRLDTLFMDGGLFAEDFFGAGWMWDDEADPFMPYLSAFPFNSNTITVTLTAPAKAGVPVEVRTIPSSASITVQNNGKSSSSTDISIEKYPRTNRITISGKLRAGQKTVKRLSMWKPETIVADRLLAELEKLGIQTDSVIVVYDAPSIAEIEVGAVLRPLDDVLEEMNKESDNLCAEVVLRMLASGKTHAKRLTADDGLSAMDRILQRGGIDTHNLHLRDGSGISFYNLVSAHLIGDLLCTMAGNAAAARYRRSLAVGGVDGTLKRRMGEIPSGTFTGKTGTVSGVSALSGYVQAPGGRLLSVVILMQNFFGSSRPYREVQDKIVGYCLQYSAQAGEVKPPR